MRIGAISGADPYNRIALYNDWLIKAGDEAASADGIERSDDKAATERGLITGSDTAGKSDKADGEKTEKAVLNPGESDKVAPGRKSSPAECKTCAERKYQDGSDEMVSFKSAAHISPEASASRVRAHEQEHVSNAYKKAAQNDGKVLQASVSLTTAVCPECGRSYVSGGLTRTQILYHEESPYSKNKKSLDAQALSGANFSADT